MNVSCECVCLWNALFAATFCQVVINKWQIKLCLNMLSIEAHPLMAALKFFDDENYKFVHLNIFNVALFITLLRVIILSNRIYLYRLIKNITGRGNTIIICMYVP